MLPYNAHKTCHLKDFEKKNKRQIEQKYNFLSEYAKRRGKETQISTTHKNLWKRILSNKQNISYDLTSLEKTSLNYKYIDRPKLSEPKKNPFEYIAPPSGVGTIMLSFLFVE